MALLPHFAAASNKGLMGTLEFRVDDIDALPKWKNVLKRLEAEQNLFDECDETPSRCISHGLQSWRMFVANANDLTFEAKLQKVNDFINEWPYIEDIQNWVKSDYWATPTEFLDKSGDCEDYAIIKYVTLKELGLNPSQMRIVVVRDDVRQLYHAVLVVYDNNNQPHVLDSLYDAVLLDEDVLQYTPQYSVNETTRWVHINPIYESKGEEK